MAAEMATTTISNNNNKQQWQFKTLVQYNLAIYYCLSELYSQQGLAVGQCKVVNERKKNYFGDLRY